jgi:hypothetical protein
MLGQFLGIGQEVVASVLSSSLFLPAPAGAGDRPDGDRAFADAHQDLGARSDDRETAEIEEIEEGRRIETAERP